MTNVFLKKLFARGIEIAKIGMGNKNIYFSLQCSMPGQKVIKAWDPSSLDTKPAPNFEQQECDEGDIKNIFFHEHW